MLIITKRHLNSLIIFHLTSIIITSLYFFYTINNNDLTDPVSIKKQSEIIIYLMIFIISINVPIIYILFKKNTNIITEFNKLIDFSKHHNFSNQHQSIKKLGIIGIKITELFSRINDLGNKRIVKLSSMYALVEHLSLTYNGFMIIANIQGDILFVSKAFEQKLKTDIILLQTLNIKDIIDINFKSLLIKLDIEKKVCEFQNIKIIDNSNDIKIKLLSAFPIFNSEHLLSNIVIYLNI
ncbi:MAG: hypothetical protein A2015_04385 [Spirochaetes bacterium GWF1_31_7]|nr:MAG: hypothetical protein A2Y30_16885 [Spirochaetes bacterium GWE1_32_154]OHD52590.1 MAG: hypothetical protein A2Y29_00065 [Spirochaetes bacterium GWE2_31_10]OHD52958.1 MAG: hypothetical protein A2015_04385 [Spirochaetes bacterium GWF1_31_7]OHD80238.1 MAG: hypothetical protein A2355_07170 [Spirochaetes bacterium RIFOXYB1_FULL_32_8]HBD93702.1 hypothetical protein [Spirochaetia bacterium]